MYDFCMNTKLHVGNGSSFDLPDKLLAEGWTSVGMVIDHNVRGIPPITKLIQSLKRKCDNLIIEYCVANEPTYDYLEEVRPAFMDSHLHAVIGIGGGSTLDVAKAMAVLVNNRQPALHYRGFDKMTEPVLPIITVPTIGGSGSEITPNASFIDTKEKRKLGINGEAIRPKYAFIDPQLSLSCPRDPTISAGVDAIVHAVECFISTGHNTMSRVFSGEGFKRVFNYLPRVIENPDNLSYREEVMIGAVFAAMGMMHSGGGPAIVLSYRLGVFYNVPHGIAGGIFLPEVIHHNIQNEVKEYSDLYKLMDHADHTLSIEKQADQFLERIKTLWNTLEIPSDINRYGVTKSEIDSFVSASMDMKGGLDGNPVPFYENEIKDVLKKII